MLLQRCPRCRKGRLFKGLLNMNDPCRVCGLVLEREPGYFFGAMYPSYAISIVILVPLYFLLQWLLPNWSEYFVVLLAALIYLPLSPLVFRYSRVIWIYWDRMAAPGEFSNHGGWLKWRESHKGGNGTDS
jgi:uncharacterized protein (DUF983 family)